MEYCIFIAGPKAEDVLEDWVLLDALIAYLIVTYDIYLEDQKY